MNSGSCFVALLPTNIRTVNARASKVDRALKFWMTQAHMQNV